MIVACSVALTLSVWCVSSVFALPTFMRENGIAYWVDTRRKIRYIYALNEFIAAYLGAQNCFDFYSIYSVLRLGHVTCLKKKNLSMLFKQRTRPFK